MAQRIRLEMNDWLYNAGLVGLYNILVHSGEKVKMNEQGIEMDQSQLENFEERYFTYFIEKYEVYLSWYKIISYKDVLTYHQKQNFNSFGEEELDSLNQYIKDVKHYLSSNSYKAAYELIGSQVTLLELAKKLQTIKLKKKETIGEKLIEIKETVNKLNEIIGHCMEEDYKKYLAGKNVIYTIIKNGWNGVSILNPQTKEKDIYMDYKNYFVKPVEDYMGDDKSTKKYNCFTCDREMKDLKNDLSFLNQVGFDVSRKASHTWDFVNDIAICPICKLVFSCVPAGMTYVYSKGIYINDNNSFQRAVNVNQRIKSEILKEHEDNRLLTYRALVKSIQEQIHEKIKYELADIQVIRYEEEKYRFNILTRQMIKIIQQSKHSLGYIHNSGFKEVNTYFNIYELVIERVLNNQNLFTLIHKLLSYKLSSPKNCRFTTSQVISVLEINFRFLEGMGYMQNADQDMIKKANVSGYYLREQYKVKGAKDKLNGVSYRLLNALKTNKKDMFMDTLLNCYLYAQKTVPSIFLDALEDEEKYKTIGYAFVAGLIEGKDHQNKEGDQ
ncbi:CRISPR-associated CXXC_CXXC protein Cst1 [Alkaliphilus metalliredigens QYMF]|uniref:CRISPR-associated CXXC_CXXC protein Cst1 n=1 Tax=Alkaliphilus metalliredigens (strain QYMF) TaxID=293826 RepID=A6TQ81_ALKMQ|nr:Cas8a1 family CRISPR/Cas system-associated protein [Alkaliphilus metalliredigens]ABR48349.1 CRISPR-associated CXXC_CXXC protein Cst1 [Alkaliphilus metalliredigens QYMF]